MGSHITSAGSTLSVGLTETRRQQPVRHRPTELGENRWERGRFEVRQESAEIARPTAISV
jgi:hypothetical protein